MGKTKAKKPQLLDESSSDSEVDFKINKSYAVSYDKWRHGEELQKLKAKYGSDTDTSSSSESEELAPVVERDFLKTLSLLKSKDPQIYDENTQFFTEESAPEKKVKEKKKKKPLYPKDYERKMLLETNGRLSDSEDEVKPAQLTYDEEQEEIRRSLKAAMEDLDSDEDDDGEGLMKVREKGKKEKEQEDEDYVQWLKGEKDNLSDEDSGDVDLTFLRNYWNDPGLDSDEQFLRDYILNKKYTEEDDDDEEIPTYEEITKDVDTLSDDEKVLEKQEIFEHKYNFRFEEPDEEFIKRYPRTVGDSLRKKDNKRKLKREEYLERKKKEKEQKKEELRRLKALKRKEIEEKLERLRETVGNEQLAFDDLDVEGDFDPEEHDRKMKELFNEDYCNVEETERPEFPSDEELDCENWDNWTGGDQGGHLEGDDRDGPHCEDPDFNMDADYDPKAEFQRQMIESTKKRNRRLKKKSKFAEAVSQAKPVFDPSSKTFERYFDEYYQLDCEDVIGDLCTRFKYRRVVPNDFGLSTDEILAARDKELNRWCSLKKACQYRREEEELYDVQAFKKKATSMAAKRRVFLSLYGEPEEQEAASSQQPVEDSPKKRKGKRKKATHDVEGASSQEVTETEELAHASLEEEHGSTEEEDRPPHKRSRTDELSRTDADAVQNGNAATASEPKRKRKRKKKKPFSSENETFAGDASPPAQNGNRARPSIKSSKKPEVKDKRLLIPDSRLKAYGINPKKFKNRIKFSKKS